MKKNVVGISIILTLLILTSLSCVVSAKGINYYYEISEKIFDNIESEENETNLGTFGPVSPLFNISKITLLNGSASEIEKIERILKNRILQLFLPLTIIKCNDLDFSVSYLKNVPQFIPIIRHLSYYTTLYKDSNFPFSKVCSSISLIFKYLITSLNSLFGSFLILSSIIFRKMRVAAQVYRG